MPACSKFYDADKRGRCDWCGYSDDEHPTRKWANLYLDHDNCHVFMATDNHTEGQSGITRNNVEQLAQALIDEYAYTDVNIYDITHRKTVRKGLKT